MAITFGRRSAGRCGCLCVLAVEVRRAVASMLPGYPATLKSRGAIRHRAGGRGGQAAARGWAMLSASTRPGRLRGRPVAGRLTLVIFRKGIIIGLSPVCPAVSSRTGTRPGVDGGVDLGEPPAPTGSQGVLGRLPRHPLRAVLGEGGVVRRW